MATTNDFKRGMRVELDGDPFVVIEYSTQSASARGSNTLVRAKLRNLKSGQLIDRSFRAGERIKEPDFEIRPAQYLYDEGGEHYVFMDQETYDQFTLDADTVSEQIDYLRPNDDVRALIFNGNCIGIEVSPTVILRVAATAPGARGDTVTNVTKPATLETGLEVQVPVFINEGELVVVDTREARYVRRA